MNHNNELEIIRLKREYELISAQIYENGFEGIGDLNKIEWLKQIGNTIRALEA